MLPEIHGEFFILNLIYFFNNCDSCSVVQIRSKLKNEMLYIHVAGCYYEFV